MSRRSALVLLGAVAALVAGELFGRIALGLGDPPLYRPHPTIEYLLVSDQSCRPFGNRFEVNGFGMRSAPFPARRSSRDELRVMVLGDSVVNGGSLTDQGDLATFRARRTLAARLARPVVVGNISSGSWGPGNWLGYVEEYGLFDADVAILVLSSHDAFDVARFAGLDEARQPTRKPRLALADGLRYLPRFLPGRRQPGAGPRRSAMAELEALLARLAEAPAAAVLLHPRRAELASAGWEAGAELIRQAVETRGLRLDGLDGFYGETDPGELYRDAIHPSAKGQEQLGRAIVEVVLELLEAREAR